MQVAPYINHQHLVEVQPATENGETQGWEVRLALFDEQHLRDLMGLLQEKTSLASPPNHTGYMETVDPYLLIIGASVILVASFFFGELSRRTNVPSVLMLIVLGILLKFGIDKWIGEELDFLPVLKVLGAVEAYYDCPRSCLRAGVEEGEVPAHLKINVSCLGGAIGISLVGGYDFDVLHTQYEQHSLLGCMPRLCLYCPAPLSFPAW
ncbi:MAG: hypothetical protein R2795_01580 [Saprospiraceae bacterium]